MKLQTKNKCRYVIYKIDFLGKKAREADRERIKRLRDQTRQSIPGEGDFQRSRGDAQSLPQVSIVTYWACYGIIV